MYKDFVELIVDFYWCSVYYRGDRQGDGVRGRGYNTLLHLYIITIIPIYVFYIIRVISSTHFR